MSIEVVDGRCTFDLFDIFGGLNADQIAELVDAIGCSDAVIKAVSEQIIDGWTAQSSHGATSYGPEPCTALDKAVDEVARRSGDVATRRIESLERMAAHYKEMWEKEMSERHRLERACTDLRVRLRSVEEGT